jgi:hypothetical protein
MDDRGALTYGQLVRLHVGKIKTHLLFSKSISKLPRGGAGCPPIKCSGIKHMRFKMQKDFLTKLDRIIHKYYQMLKELLEPKNEVLSGRLYGVIDIERVADSKRYGGQPLLPPDVRMVLIGKCLEVYSRHYGAIVDWNGEPRCRRAPLSAVNFSAYPPPHEAKFLKKNPSPLMAPKRKKLWRCKRWRIGDAKFVGRPSMRATSLSPTLRSPYPARNRVQIAF